MQTESHLMSSHISYLCADVLYLADILTKQEFNQNGLSKTEEEWINFADREQIYDQIRYIGIDGNEIIRINYHADGSVATNDDELQNKADRLYFTDSITLEDKQIYISKIDLNIENHQIEKPIKPMLRLATPVFDSSGTLKGIVIVNYYAKYLLHNFEHIAISSFANVFLVNADGYWISNDLDETTEWAFMYEEKLDISFSNEFPEAWYEMTQNDSGTITTSQGYFIYSKIILSQYLILDNDLTEDQLVLGEGDLYAVAYIPQTSDGTNPFFTSVYENILYTLQTQIFGIIAIFFIALLLAILITHQQIEQEQIQYFSEYDTMTDVLNRRAGLESLKQMYTKLKKTGGSMSICFADINGLKEVNDTLGHEFGDELIKSVAEGIKQSLRQNDTVMRLGGDEFLIVLDNTNEQDAELVWDRVKKFYDTINRTEDRPYKISVSHGTATFSVKATASIDELINTADKRMYEEKRQMKIGLKIVT